MTEMTNNFIRGATLLAGLLAVACSQDSIVLEKTATMIGAAGGTARSADGRAQLEVAPGAVSEEVEFTIELIRSTSPELVSSIYEFGPDGTTFAAPVDLTIDVTPSGDRRFYLANLNGARPERVAGSTYDSVRGRVEGRLEHFSRYGVVVVHTPCINRACGDQCLVCDPNDTSCTEPSDPHACDGVAACVPAANLVCGPPDAGVMQNGAVDSGQVTGPPDSGVLPEAGPLSPDAGLHDGAQVVRDASDVGTTNPPLDGGPGFFPDAGPPCASHSDCSFGSRCRSGACWSHCPAGRPCQCFGAYDCALGVQCTNGLCEQLIHEVEPNPRTSAHRLPPVSGPISVEGSLSPSGDEDWFELHLLAPARVSALTYSQLGNPSVCMSGTDTVLTLFGNGVQLAQNDDANGTMCSEISTNVPAGVYQVRVSHFTGMVIQRYYLDLSVQ